MKPRPIILSIADVRQILKGKMTQYRSIVGPQPENLADRLKTPVPLNDVEAIMQSLIMVGRENLHTHGAGKGYAFPRCPFGHPGDLLYVKEAMKYDEKRRWHYVASPEVSYLQEGDTLEDPSYSLGLKQGGSRVFLSKQDRGRYEPTRRSLSALKMPKCAARIWLRIINVRVQRIQDITTEEAIANGYESEIIYGDVWNPIELFQTVWAGSHRWDENPWVWVIEFERENHETR